MAGGRRDRKSRTLLKPGGRGRVGRGWAPWGARLIVGGPGATAKTPVLRGRKRACYPKTLSESCNGLGSLYSHVAISCDRMCTNHTYSFGEMIIFLRNLTTGIRLKRTMGLCNLCIQMRPAGVAGFFMGMAESMCRVQDWDLQIVSYVKF